MSRNVYLLAIATFSAATEGSVFVGLLASMAQDLGVSVGEAGQLSAAFAIAFALTAPLSVNFASRFNQKRVLNAALLTLGLLNISAATMHSFWALMAIRICCGMIAPLVIPVSYGSASKLVPLEQRGRALAIVQLGFIFANFIGIPIGTMIGAGFGWRASFIFAGAIAILSAAVLQAFIPNIPGSQSSSPKNLLLGFKRPAFDNLLIMCLAQMGAFSSLSFIGPLSEKVGGLQGKAIAIVQATFAVGTFFGAKWGGRFADKGKSDDVIPGLSLGLAAAMFGLSALMVYGHSGDLTSAILLAGALNVGLFFLSSLIPNIQYRLISVSPEHRATLIALNSSFIFAGQGLGAALGGLVLDRLSINYLGYVGTGLNLLGFLVGAVMLAALPVQSEILADDVPTQVIKKAG